MSYRLELSVHPHRGLGPLTLGMSVEQALDAMARLEVEGKRQRLWDMRAEPPVQYDAFPPRVWFANVSATFTSAQQLEYIEVSDGPVRALIDCLDVLELEQSVAIDHLSRTLNDQAAVEEDGTCVVFRGAAMALWRGGDDERAVGRWETIGIGVPGYHA